jgi:hypothetical protein
MKIQAMLNPLFAPHLEVALLLPEGRKAAVAISLTGDGGTARLADRDTALEGVTDWAWEDDLLRLRTRVRNSGEQPVIVEGVRYVFRGQREQPAAEWRVFRDAGECAWCGVKRLDALAPDPSLGVIAEQRTGEAQEEPTRFHRSSLQTVLYDARGRRAWLVGFLRQRHGFNGVDVWPDAEKRRVERTEAWQEIGARLLPGQEWETDPLVVMSDADPLALLEIFAGHVQAHHGRAFTAPPEVGMMTWYGYGTAIDRDIVLQNADLITDLFSGYPQPMRALMLLDHGWQEDANWGYWDEADQKRFPEGMKWLADQLRRRGLQLALWYTPFCITENAPNLHDLLPLRALDEEGKPYAGQARVWGHLPGHPSGDWTITFLDGALDEVQAKWARELRRMAQEWGCVYWKLDFFNLITSAARKRLSPAGELYARTYDTFRHAVGHEGHLAPCSCYTNIQLGYNDSIRIAADIGIAGTWPGQLPHYRRAFTTIAALWYKHRRFWVNDPDSIQIGRGCALNEARVRATAVAFSGGHLMVSEDLRWLSPDRLELIRRLLPAYGIAARPLDLFEHVYPDDIPHIWRLPVQSDWGARDALAIFNLTEDVMRVQVAPEWFGLEPGEAFAAVEWWQERWLGRFNGPFEIAIPPADVAVLHAQSEREHPWLISVSHHFTGGWIVENLRFDDATCQLRGELVTRPGLRLSLMGTLPPGWAMAYSAHGCANGAGGWTHEVLTTSERTPFAIPFVREG